MLDKFKESVKDFSENVKSKVAEKELDDEVLDPLLENLRLKLLQNNVSLEVAEEIEDELRNTLVGQEVRRDKVEEKVYETVEEVLLEGLDDSFDFMAELESAQSPVVFMMGFNGSGKCVSGDTVIYTESGVSPIENIYDEYSHLEENKTEKGVYVEPDDLNVHSVSQGDLNSELKNVSKLWKLESDRMLDISFSTGKRVSVTPEHPLFSITEGVISKRNAEDISKDDYVMIPSKIDAEVQKSDY
ncbi:MAG: signal recognition particle receptor subunit alpha, partial [Candidatus Nanohaloarchaea archaeon]